MNNKGSYKNKVPKDYKQIAKGLMRKGKLSENYCKKCHKQLKTELLYEMYEWCEHCGYSSVQEIQNYLKEKIEKSKNQNGA